MKVLLLMLVVKVDTSAMWGPLTGGPQCRMLNLRNGHVACPLALHVHCHLYKMLSCCMSNLGNALCRVTHFFLAI